MEWIHIKITPLRKATVPKSNRQCQCGRNANLTCSRLHLFDSFTYLLLICYFQRHKQGNKGCVALLLFVSCSLMCLVSVHAHTQWTQQVYRLSLVCRAPILYDFLTRSRILHHLVSWLCSVVAEELFEDKLTARVAESFEEAARSLGAYWESKFAICWWT